MVSWSNIKIIAVGLTAPVTTMASSNANSCNSSKRKPNGGSVAAIFEEGYGINFAFHRVGPCGPLGTYYEHIM